MLPLIALAVQAEWWGFRGPGGNGVLELKTLPAEWGESKNIAWKAAIPGKGHSSPILAGGRVFLTTSVEGETIPGKKAVKHVIGGETFVHPQTASEDKRVALHALAVDAASGKILWNHKVYDGDVYDGRHQFNTFASPTPITDGKTVFFYFESQGLYAFDFEGKALWKMSVGGVAKLGLAAGTSPVMAGGVIVLQADEDNGEKSFLYGVSPKNGEIVWKTKRDVSVTYNTPVVVKNGKDDVVVTAATEHVIAYDAASGKELWRGPGIGGYAAASPVSGLGLVFPNSYHPVKKLMAMRVDPKAGERVAWQYEKGTAYVPSPILYGEHLYLMTDSGMLSCLEAKTGKVVYEGKRLPKPGKFTASPVAFDGKLLLTNQDGDTYVVQAGAEHAVLGTNSLGEAVYASPALDGDSIYVRGAQHLYRIRRQ
ncbi:MAG: PQQ-binding-like beta-propeller repeat protein [Bryobacterales bacterium]|nr:PQQ-binding-like beta-propeller repeat protein [Bryobacterales bacterium]